MSGLSGLQLTNISEEQVIVAFHSFLQGALAQAHAERLLDESILSSAEADIQIAGPAVCLFLAALRSEGNPPRIATSMISLDVNNCPASFRNWFILWSECVPLIKVLPADLRNDLARIICDQEPQSQPIRIDIPILAHNLRAIAIEISQRRTFQERFNQDLDYALQFGNDLNAPPQNRRSAAFRPPPAYPERPPSPPSSAYSSRQTEVVSDATAQNSVASSPNPQDHTALAIIRETLYASLTDILYATPTIFQILQSQTSTDGELSRAYFAALCLAILEVSIALVSPAERQVRLVQLGRGYPAFLRMEDCPPHLQPLAAQLFLIASCTQALEQEDLETGMQVASAGDTPTQTKIDQLKMELQHGINWEANPNLEDIGVRATSSKETVRLAANRINAMALGVSQIPSFREREEALFEVLVPSLSKRQRRKV